ncbi:MAG: UDP-N-acetylmuramoyl-L-alanine--D-glutamate ligase [Nitrospirales bacterium]|nr:UDP-N-acetylmuramoyl-L-alanine--D-glutamate ligase [Nitrospirales bacterium]
MSGTVTPRTNWKGQSVTVFGLGRSGESAAHLLVALGATVTIVEERITAEVQQAQERFLRQGVEVLVGNLAEQGCMHADLVVISPGVPKEHPVVRSLKERGVPVIAEIELASWLLSAPIVAVTGTNGKSTTVRLIGAVLQQSGKKAFVGGNLGIPLCEAVPKSQRNSVASDYEWVVAEVSSFQLEAIHRFRPHIAVLLNVTPDHLDRHPTKEDYIQAKQRIFENQTPDDIAFINWDDAVVRAMVAQAPSQMYAFSLKGPVERGVYLDGTTIRARMKGTEISIMERDQVCLRGDHNIANAMVAIGVGLLCGCSVQDIVEGLKQAPTFEHALEPVREWQGIRFINDSKGTNVDATLKAIQSFREPLILILGGKDKGGDFSQLVESITRGVKRLVVIGEATAKIQTALGHVKPLTVVDTLTEAVDQAVQAACPGDVVLFSPACASFDMFRNYHHRGQEFKRIVGELR